LEEAGPLKVLYRKHDLLVIDKASARQSLLETKRREGFKNGEDGE